MRLTFFFTITLAFLCVATSVSADNSFSKKSDMFYDQNWVYDRPSVPSDRGRSADLFPSIPLMYNQNADMYDHTRPRYTYGREDMFPSHGIGLTRPYHVLTIDPQQGPYNAR